MTFKTRHQREESKSCSILQSVQTCVDQVIDKVGKNIKLGIPLAAGKPNQFVNALYLRAKENPEINLTILTALTLEKPKGKSLLEKNFIEPFAERVFGNYPDLLYELDRTTGKLPANIKVIEFYFPAGKFSKNKDAQRNYISSNYTHVARDLVDRGVNVLAQIVSKSEDGTRLSMSCNPDVMPDIIKELEDSNVALVAQVNNHLPYMYGEADVPADTYHFIIDNPEYDFKIFGPPKMSVPDVDYVIGLHASTLVKDGGELQVGIGSLGDALIYAMLIRHKENKVYKGLLEDFGILKKHKDIIASKGGITPFEEGLFGASEMFVDAFMHLIKNDILKRKVYDHYILQRLINEGLINPNKINNETLYHLISKGAINAEFTQKDFDFLMKYGILDSNIVYKDGHLIFPDGTKAEANLNVDEASGIITTKAIGDKLKNGSIVHGGFFLGPTEFYEWLKNLPEEKRRLIQMKSVRAINQLYGHEELDRLHRKDARFINTCLMMTLTGAAVSDGLEDGTVISGVGGQYNFVDMAHALPDGHSIIQLRSTRNCNGVVKSNIVWNYGHITIPRHLRDIVISEYGIANIRGRTDEEIIKSLIQIADSRFQKQLVEQAVKYGKLSSSYQVPEKYRNNYPDVLVGKLDKYKKDGYFKSFPFGTDFTHEEQVVGKALKSLKRKTATPLSKVSTILKALLVSKASDKLSPYLKRMKLENPKTMEERLYHKLLVKELSYFV